MAASRVEALVRELAPQVLGALVRRYGNFDDCEEAVQEALVAAALQWPEQGIPDNPRAWLVTVASRRFTDTVRRDTSRRRREESTGRADPSRGVQPAADEDPVATTDDTLALLFLCCHADLTPASQLALTLRAVGGLTTREIARAFLVPEATMTQRITRAKQRIKTSGQGFRAPSPDEQAERLPVVLQVLYLIFTEGYAATAGRDASRPDLTAEAIRLTRTVQRLLPDDSEVTALLALMLLSEARRPARIDDGDSQGGLVALADQDRTLWDRSLAEEGLALVPVALTRGPVGPYQVQAAIAAVHAEAERAEDTDWPQIAALYQLLDRIAPNPVVTLNRAVAVGMADRPEAGLALLKDLDTDPRVADGHRLYAARAYLLELAGDEAAAVDGYREAARRATSVPERRWLEARATRLAASH